MTPRPPKVDLAPSIMRTTGWADYALVDSGDGKKLERYGPYSVVRPRTPGPLVSETFARSLGQGRRRI